MRSDPVVEPFHVRFFGGCRLYWATGDLRLFYEMVLAYLLH